MKEIIFLVLTLVANFCYSQNEIKERKPFLLRLVVDKEQFYQIQINKSEYFVKENVIQIFPTEQLNIEAEIKNDTISSMKVVEKIENPKKLYKFNFCRTLKITNLKE
ncbi:hypothetical protein [Flavobacterium luteolum]|uniref:hypothetical protein n=1 Tax=Flavobacterium luteolum TaxID=3003259 RepID=UPI00248F27B1|nr:hypothetical protein [Flavobacterium luteolum]